MNKITNKLAVLVLCIILITDYGESAILSIRCIFNISIIIFDESMLYRKQNFSLRSSLYISYFAFIILCFAVCSL